MTLLTRDELLGLTARRYKELDTPIGKVRIRSLTEEERSDFESHLWNAKGEYQPDEAKKQRRRLVAMVLVDNQGNRLIADNELDKLKGVDGAVLAAIFAAAREHCGLTEDSLKVLAKNSEPTTDDDSATT